MAFVACLVSTLASAEDCKSIQDSTARLVCFDRTSIAPTAAKKAAAAKSDPLALTKGAMGRTLKDPQSAIYTDMVRAIRPNARGEPTDSVCGAVNAKNSYGGYIGARPFLHLIALDQIYIAGDGDLGSVVVRNFCK
jgi:hypothetical protein